MTPSPWWLALGPAPSTEPLPSETDARADVAAPDWLGDCALQVTPRVARLDEVWGLEVSCTWRLWGGLAGVLSRLRAEVMAGAVPGGGEPPPVWSMGPTALAALARWRAGHRVPLWDSGTGVPDAPPLLDLPLHTLGAARPHVPVLARLGLRTWGHLRRLPRAGVARRWGASLLLALDQALGLSPETHAWRCLPPGFDLTRELPHALDSAPALLPHAEVLLAALQDWLRPRRRGVLALRWQWAHDARRDGPLLGGFELRIAQPTQSLDHLLRLTREHLARQPLAAPVVALRLSTVAHAPWVPDSTDWLQVRPADGSPCLSWAELTERLGARLGVSALTRWQPHSDHRAEHMQRVSPPECLADSPCLKSERGPGLSDGREPAGVSVTSGSLWPTWVLPVPQPLAVRDHRPCFQGALQLLAGPQRLELTQWPGAGTSGAPSVSDGEEARVRDYFVARSPGAGLLWVYRVPPGARWFLHGVFA